MKQKKNKAKNEAPGSNETTPTPPLTNPKRALTQAEALKLAQLEAVIQAGKESFVEIGLVLGEILKQRLAQQTSSAVGSLKHGNTDQAA